MLAMPCASSPLAALASGDGPPTADSTIIRRSASCRKAATPRIGYGVDMALALLALVLVAAGCTSAADARVSASSAVAPTDNPVIAWRVTAPASAAGESFIGADAHLWSVSPEWPGPYVDTFGLTFELDDAWGFRFDTPRAGLVVAATVDIAGALLFGTMGRGTELRTCVAWTGTYGVVSDVPAWSVEIDARSTDCPGVTISGSWWGWLADADGNAAQ